MRYTFEPINPKTLKTQEYDQVIESPLFLKEKRDESIKVHMVAGGNKHSMGCASLFVASSNHAAFDGLVAFFLKE